MNHIDRPSASYQSYVSGFISSLVLTLLSFALVSRHLLHGNAIVGAVIGLALVQLVIQLIFFLHLGRESSPRWNLVFFGGAALTVFILVVGSLWIMAHLNYHQTSPKQTDQYILKDEGVKP